MTKTLTILTVLILSTISSFGQTVKLTSKAEHYKTKDFNAAIFPADFFGLFPRKRFTPTKQEIDQAEISLKNNLKILNKQLLNQLSTPVIHKNLRKYRRQYFGFIDNNGDKILFINCFWDRSKDDSKFWLTEEKVVHDGGSYFWNVKFNLDKNELFELNINGYA